MPYDYAGMQSRVPNHLIDKFGFTAVLRRGYEDRPCRVCEAFYTEREYGDLIQRGDRRYYLKAAGLDMPPDNEQDVLVVPDGTDEVIYVIVSPPTRVAPGNVVMYWDLHTRTR